MFLIFTIVILFEVNNLINLLFKNNHYSTKNIYILFKNKHYSI